MVGLCLAAAGAASADPSQRAILDKYCVTCHNQRLKTGGLTLDTHGSCARFRPRPKSGKRSILKLRSGTMPPAGMPRPDAATYSSLARLARGTNRSSFRAVCRPPDPAPSQSLRIRQRDPRFAGTGHRRRLSTASRRFGVWLRQHLRCSGRIAVASGTLSRRRAENRRSRGGRSQDRAGQRNLAHPAGSFSGPARRMACRSAPSAELWSVTTFRSTASTPSKRTCIEPI